MRKLLKLIGGLLTLIYGCMLVVAVGGTGLIALKYFLAALFGW